MGKPPARAPLFLSALLLSSKPAAPTFHYGYERITFFSAGFEGAMIIVAAIWILIEAIEKWIIGIAPRSSRIRCAAVAWSRPVECLARLVSAQFGKRSHSLILEANGTPVLTDSATSFGVVAGLGLVS